MKPSGEVQRTNSSTALIARLAFIPRRIGYNRDTRGMLLTDPIAPPRNPDKSWKLTPAAHPISG